MKNIPYISASTALNNAIKILQQAYIYKFQSDAKIILFYVLNLVHLKNLIYQLHKKISIKIYLKYIHSVRRRGRSEPIVHIIKNQYFWDINYYVNNFSLIPRLETQLIIELVLKNYKYKLSQITNILDLGVGSGSIILPLLTELTFSTGLGVDISKKALSIARFNARKYNLNKKVDFKISNCFTSISYKKKFNVIIFNPPYMSINDWNNLIPEVLNYEPKNSLTDFNNGIKYYEIVKKQISIFLKNSGIIIFEIGINQSSQIVNIFEKKIYNIKIFEDLNFISRIIVVYNN